ncbi:AbrB/MazE/SpoVT family DNA-binding domain-containing protein [Sphaerobacter thermophilus]|jgi:AbrB family looped-hinge helix DNA binding protein|uniref:Transcriptional regulator, AbrB family n=1 Tax=Sphaerobacter thermophilus (strain ATCC 49802 / DSM 20745 / KCCM 41009 / NCIMB 13125 / S 6022) TaxID=479434 RepID=D1C7C3_SPHTD|nr:AbrB/MazE/SpoVT family DNA-binding domain-containing protein [Sphaerobacter thermophilus]ACZ39769.1 transcriptional regulator, AbrB family [Sphaerobacter thermophilus DSM 20745]PZN60782.1 MAG: AbrB/MazE/SpoVT family DNA-binding domain-containing protein [Sphaerobacter thermophilus]
MGRSDRATKIIRPLRNGQITIPAEFRRELGITEDSILEITLEDDALRITPLQVRRSPGSQWIRELYERFEPVRREAEAMDEAEINRSIDEAVRGSRRTEP